MSINRRFANRLLRHLPVKTLALIENDLRPISYSSGTTLLDSGERIDFVLFPESGMVSIVAPQVDGESPELAGIGREGVVGPIAAIGSRETYGRWLAQVPGKAWRCPAPTFQKAFDEDGAFRQHIVCYMEALLSLTMQSVACNAIHPVEERLSRWILMMRDRSDDDRLPLTQEFLGQMLSVHRSSINGASQTLREKGLISAQKGAVTVEDRKGLENAACHCYRLVKQRYEALMPGSFS
ncbi:Crp/Fnr family transcriptional regulator [Hoeflea sp. WL0058]|uniref:Crp/Fnr family transcriptional regulator n=1 Tax=Flavimaribacter sediminis TaxID=2865987 RepID=A0AAE3D436_9HYPH|nr:Crp/Fnr family transcriptional regulator [Flavimaribacter sediminis]MBW8640657.1 Crp/Fnr family transcriptional regulator [Flavimaribacter sediminis]